MVKVRFIETTGLEKSTDVPIGTTLMEAAIKVDVDGIPAECGGACSCATCHVHVAPEWVERLEPASEMELSILDLAESFDEKRSRLSCQIELMPNLDGLYVAIPSEG